MFSGRVIRGLGVARVLGYPTANIDVPFASVDLDGGVYAAWTELRGSTYPSALVVLPDEKKIEVHLLDYSGGDCYGAEMTVAPIKKVSELIPPTAVDMKEKIAEDIRLVRAALNTV